MPDEGRASLEARYPGEYVEAAGVRLRVRDQGPRDGAVLVLLHGFGASLQTWDGWVSGLSGRYRVVRFDLPGFGLTGADPTGDYSDGRACAVLLALLDRLGVGRATLIGHSMGGRMAWRFAAEHPERVAGLVLVSPDGFASPELGYGVRSKVPLVVRLLPYVLPRGMLRSSLAAAYGDPRRLTDATLTRYRDMLLAPGTRGAIVARTGQTLLEDPVPVLRRVSARTLLLWGVKDGMIPVSNAQDYLRAMPDARLVVLPGLGHVPFEEAPGESLAPVLGFLGGG